MRQIQSAIYLLKKINVNLIPVTWNHHVFFFFFTWMYSWDEIKWEEEKVS